MTDQKRDEFIKGTFPDGFLWGTATASYQIEGAYNEDGKCFQSQRQNVAPFDQWRYQETGAQHSLQSTEIHVTIAKFSSMKVCDLFWRAATAQVAG